MKLIAAYNILDRRRLHLIERIADAKNAVPKRPTTRDEREVAALSLALDVLEEQFTDQGECKCNSRGRCGFCRTKTIPEMRARLLETERLVEQHGVNLGELPGRIRLRLRLAYELSQLRGLRDDLRIGPDGRSFLTESGNFFAFTPEDEGHRDALLWLGRSRHHLLDIIGRPAE